LIRLDSNRERFLFSSAFPEMHSGIGKEERHPHGRFSFDRQLLLVAGSEGEGC